MKTSAAPLLICAVLGLLPASASVAAPTAAPAAKAGIGCESFMKDFPGDMPGNRVSFERPLTIARGFGDLMSGVDVRVLSSDTKVDGTLKCRDDMFLRFELRATLPADAKILADLEKFEQAALGPRQGADGGEGHDVGRRRVLSCFGAARRSLQFRKGRVPSGRSDRPWPYLDCDRPYVRDLEPDGRIGSTNPIQMQLSRQGLQ